MKNQFISQQHLSDNELESLKNLTLIGNILDVKDYLNQFSSTKLTTTLVHSIRLINNDPTNNDALTNYNNLLLADNLNINEPSSLGGDTPLYVATLGNNLPMVKDLVKRGANIDATCINGSYPLISTVYDFKQLELFQYFLDLGADPNIITNAGDTALIYAVRGNSPQTITKLINAGANVNFINHNSRTPLQLAMYMIQTENIIENIIALCQSAKDQEQINKFKEQAISHPLCNFVIQLLNNLETKLQLEESLPISQHQKPKSFKL